MLVNDFSFYLHEPLPIALHAPTADVSVQIHLDVFIHNRLPPLEGEPVVCVCAWSGLLPKMVPSYRPKTPVLGGAISARTPSTCSKHAPESSATVLYPCCLHNKPAALIFDSPAHAKIV